MIFNVSHSKTRLSPVEASRIDDRIAPQGAAQATEWAEKMKLMQACKFLRISHSKLSMLIGIGKIKYEVTDLDHRVKLVKRSDLEGLKRQYPNDIKELEQLR